MADEVTAPAEPTLENEGGAPSEPEVQATQQPEETRPEWLDPRFKSPEDQAKAYREAEKKMQQEAQARAELERQHRELLGRVNQQAPQAPTTPEPNLNELFWQNPAEVMDKLIERRMQAGLNPFIEDKYAMEKSRYANDPDFKRFEGQIDQIMSFQPELKKQTGAVDRVYRVVRAMEFDPASERERIKADVMRELQTRTTGAVEGAGSPGEIKPTQKVELNGEERSVARKMYPDLPVQQAEKRYYDAKMKMGGA